MLDIFFLDNRTESNILCTMIQIQRVYMTIIDWLELESGPQRNMKCLSRSAVKIFRIKTITKIEKLGQTKEKN